MSNIPKCNCPTCEIGWKQQEVKVEKFEKEEFPLTSKLGIKHWRDRWCPERREYVYYLDVKDLERVLSEGYEVFSQVSQDNLWDTYTSKNDSHTGLLIGIKPIEQDSAEKVLRDFVSLCNKIEHKDNEYSRLDLSHLYDRAKRLIGGGK